MIKITIPGGIIVECSTIQEAAELLSKLGKRKCPHCYDGNSAMSDVGQDCRHCNGSGWISI